MSQNLCCSICLDQFKVPVTIPCGHTFCQKCITVHWDKMTEANMDIKCPICNEKFDPRPTLKRNVTLSDVTETIQLGTESQGATTVHRQSAMTAQAQEGLKKKSREVDKIKEDTEKKVQELSENINKTKVSLKQTSLWVNAKFASLVKVLAEKQESILSFIEQEQQLALSEAETNLSALEDRVQQLGEIQGQIATLQAMTDIQLIQESRLVEVPQMKDIALDVPTNLQGRLSLITDVLSQISKLVSEDLAKAVNAAIGQDKQGDIRSAAMSQNLCCSICLDQFKVPVTIPCGHTFCQKCITVHWDKMTETNMDIKCPICNEKFDPRPTLKRNVTLSDVTETIQLGTESQGATAVHRQSAVTAQAQVLCDRHKKALVYYCKTDSMCVCCECAIRECRNHEQVLMEEEKQRREEGLKKKSREVDKIKEDTEKKVQELSENINKTKVSLKQTSLWVNAKFASLVKVLAEKQESILSFIEQEQQLALSEAETNLSTLEDRVQQLGEIQGQIATLQAMTDIQLIQESRLVEVPQMKDIALDVPTNLQGRLSLITDVLSQISKLVSEDLEKAVNAAIGQDKQGSPQDKRPVLAVVPSPATPCSPAVKEGLSAFHCTLTFDPRTANANLQLSQGNRRAEHLVSGPRQVPPHEARFDTTWQVLCFQSFTHGQHYWEVEVSKPWAYLGVTYQGIPRKEKGKRCMVGMNELSWSLQLDERQLSAWHNGRREAVAGHPQHHRIGMLLDYEAGTLTYYGDGQARLHAFHCAFSQELFPACWIGEGVSITLCTP